MSDHDMSELDEELLALAGGESDAEEEADIAKAEEDDTTAIRVRSRSRTRTPEKEAPRIPSASPPRRGVAQKRKAKKGGVKKSILEDESEEEEGEASDAPGSPESQGSAAMEESESERESTPLLGDDDVLYPLEGKFRSERDRAEIMGMSDLQRESILAERAAEVDRRNQDRHLRRLLQAQEKSKAADGKKRKAGIADLEDEGRLSSRVKSAKSERLESYMRQREQRNQQRRRDEARRARGRRSSSANSRATDRDADGDSDVEYDERPTVRDEPPVFRDYDLVRVGRSNFSKVCFYPGFEEAIIGCFARVSIGMDKSTGQNVYRMAQVKGFTEGKPYAMEVGNGIIKRIIITDQYAILAHGKAEKEWPFMACSDSKITEAEFKKWKETVKTDNLREPTKRFLADKLQGIHDLLNRTWTEDALKQKFDRQNKYAKHDGPVIGLSALQQKSAPPPTDKKHMSQGERLAELNRQNRQRNIEEIRRAQIAEKKAEAMGRAAAKAKAERLAKEREEKERLKVPGVDDLFEGVASDVSRTGTPQPEKKEKKKLEIKGIPTFRKRNMDDDILGSMDLGIDIEI